MSEKLSFLGGLEPSEPEVMSTGAVVAGADQAPVAAEAPVAGGTPTVQTSQTASAQSPTVQATEGGQAPISAQVPISALLDEREKRQAERAARENLERQLAAISARANPPQPATQAEAVQAALYQQNLRSSRRFAEREYGKENIASLHDWAARRCDEDPDFNQRMRASEDPYEAAYQAYHREQILQTVKPDDLAAFKAWQAAQASSHPPSSRATPVPRTLATAPGNGGAGVAHVPIGPGQAFAATINR